MSVLSGHLLVSVAGWMDMLSDPNRLGLMVMIAVAAIIIGRIVHNLWPKGSNPALWGTLAAVLFVGGLAYAGVAEAAVVVWLFIAAAVVMGVLALVLG